MRCRKLENYEKKKRKIDNSQVRPWKYLRRKTAEVFEEDKGQKSLKIKRQSSTNQ